MKHAANKWLWNKPRLSLHELPTELDRRRDRFEFFAPGDVTVTVIAD